MEGKNCIQLPEEKALKYSALSIMDLPAAEKTRTIKEAEIERLARDFAANKVSAAGVAYIVNDRTRVRRTLWLIGVILCTLVMGYLTLKVIMEYLQYPKVLIKEDIIRRKLPFPAVTICSLNPIFGHFVEETSLKKFLELKKMMQKVKRQQFNITLRDACYANPLCEWSWFQEKCTCVDNPCLTEFCLTEGISNCSCSPLFCNSSRQVEGCRFLHASLTPYSQQTCQCEGFSTEDTWEKSIIQKDIEELYDSIEDQEVKDVIRLIKHAKTYDLVDIEEALMPSTKELYHYGVTFDSLVASCSFEGRRCHRENFTVLYDPTYGKCYMFNYVGYNIPGADKPIEIERYGSTSGLQLLLRVTDRKALDLLRREIGARIVIHDPHILPFVAEYGVNVRPRDMTAVELSLSNVQRLGNPWGSCEDENKQLYNGDPYTLLGCEKSCGYKHMATQCNCTMRHYLRGTILSNTSSQFPFCNITDEVQRECAYRVSQSIEKMTGCDCKAPCRETVYSYTVTSSELNENYYRTVKAVRTLTLDSEGEKVHMNYSDVKSMVGVKVYYNTFQVSNSNEVASYSWETLMANIGGNLGFFMGLTLVTFLEIAEFIWDLFGIACGRVTKDNKVRKLPTAKTRDITQFFSSKAENFMKRRLSV
ncbi:degenerin del-1-like isoform X2 [Argiope bruennichi]|nr:degenerin del-1-like isoform X2 [Argiope bruennichi]XP_055934088.1 degenerin del-1-like isoform X2 [Argiope bruennichi]